MLVAKQSPKVATSTTIVAVVVAVALFAVFVYAANKLRRP
jgi:preprotein translocase subunit SecE